VEAAISEERYGDNIKREMRIAKPEISEKDRRIKTRTGI
jgi:hypothetical protein